MVSQTTCPGAVIWDQYTKSRNSNTMGFISIELWNLLCYLTATVAKEKMSD